MKSIVDKLVSRIDAIEQSGSTSGENEGGLDEDAVIQLIEQTVDTTKFATKDELKSQTHTSSQISDRISEYNVTNVVNYEFKGMDRTLFIVQGQPTSTESYIGIYIINLWPFVFSTFSLTLVYNDQEYQITNESNIEKQDLEDKVWFEATDGNFYMHFEDPKKSINFTIKDFLIDNEERSTQNISVIYYPPIAETDMNVDHLITAKSVKQYCDKFVTKNEFNSQTHTTLQISDRISEYNNTDVYSSCQYHLPESSIFQFVDDTNYDYIHCTTTDKTPFSITVGIKSQFVDEELYTYTNEDIPLNVTNGYVKLKLTEESLNYDIQIRITSVNDIEGEFKVKNISINGETKPDETISFEYTANKYKTNMYSQSVMTANAIRGYVEAILKENGVIQ